MSTHKTSEPPHAEIISRNAYDGPPQCYRLQVAYDGTHFHGWQKQEPPDSEPLRTVQQVVENALRDLLKQPISLHGASRTDAGVHAIGQVAQFDAATPIPIDRLGRAITSRLPDDVDIRNVWIVPNGAHVIRDVESKQYRYTIHNAPHRPLSQRHSVYHCTSLLDIDRMNDAANRLLGTHDVAGFAAASHGRESTIRTIHHCKVTRETDQPERINVYVEGDGFLYHMVRIITGTLIEIGRGRFEPNQIDAILESADRSLAGPTLPPNGLCLMWIRYAD